MIPHKTRAERGLAPYVSPRAAWDDGPERPEPVVLVAVAPSRRRELRAHRRAVAKYRRSL